MRKIFLVLPVILALSGCWEVSKGEKVGVIVKCAKEGLFVKTYECELIRGGMTSGSGNIGQSFHFTAEDAEDFPTLEAALTSQQEVKISYHKEWIAAPWRSETHDRMFLDSIQIMGR